MTLYIMRIMTLYIMHDGNINIQSSASEVRSPSS